MKKSLIIFLLAIIHIGCDPGYGVYVRNRSSSSSLYLTTRPAIESLYDSIHSSYYDSVIAYKLKQNGSYSIYRIKPNGIFKIWSYIGTKPDSSNFPFNYFELADNNDTLILDGKSKILERIKKADKKLSYYIEIGNTSN